MKRSNIRQLRTKDLPEIREQILRKQNGICPICEREITNPCLDHHHKKRLKGTGLIRGVLCRSCNVFIAKSENNAVRYAVPLERLSVILRNMAAYFEQEHYPYMHPSEAPPHQKLQKSSYNQLTKHLKEMGKKIPAYPRAGKMTKELQELFEKYGIAPKFYSSP